MITLILDGNKADITSELDILLSKTKNDYKNPTIVKNSFSKTVSLPSTKNNDLIFHNINPHSNNTSTGLFIPTERYDFTLLEDGNVIEEGYFKLDTVEKKTDNKYYNITLYGELGNILYGLSYKTNGEKMTLGDLEYDVDDITFNAATVNEMWTELQTSGTYEEWQTFNAAVCYDGVPKASLFDPSKVWVRADTSNGYTGRVTWESTETTGMPTTYTDGEGVLYAAATTIDSSHSTYPNDTWGLVDLPRDCTPLEMRDFRAYLLRPIISVRKILASINDYIYAVYDYSIDVTDSFFSTDYYTKSWITLSMLYDLREDVCTDDCTFTVEELLADTASPAEYLISLCKQFNLFIDTNYKEKKLYLRSIGNFYNEFKTLNLEFRTLNPLSFDKNIYTLSYQEGKNTLLDNYKEKYDTDYGKQKIVTGYTFSTEEEELLSSSVFVNGVDTIEESEYFIDRSGVFPLSIMSNNSDDVNYSLFNITTETSGERTVTKITDTVSPSGGRRQKSSRQLAPNAFIYGSLNSWLGLSKGVLSDTYPRLKLNSDNSPEDGKNILILFTGLKEGKSVTPSYTSTGYEFTVSSDPLKYMISDDTPLLKELYGEGKSYYYNTYLGNNTGTDPSKDYIYLRTTLPLFSRYEYYYLDQDDEIHINNTLDFGSPQEIYVRGCSYTTGQTYDTPPTIYSSRWERYLYDLYSSNTKVVEGKAFLDDIDTAFRKFYLWDNQWWILSEVTDWNFHTHLATVKLILVNDTNNYR